MRSRLLLIAAAAAATLSILSATGCAALPRAVPIAAGAAVVGVAVIHGADQSSREVVIESSSSSSSDEDVELRDTKDLLESPAPAPLKTDDVVGGPSIGELRSAVNAIDLSSCRDAGAPRGYGHARVTVAPDGKATKIVIDGPRGLPKSAVACVGNALAAVHVTSFEGKPTTVGTTWFVP